MRRSEESHREAPIMCPSLSDPGPHTTEPCVRCQLKEQEFYGAQVGGTQVSQGALQGMASGEGAGRGSCVKDAIAAAQVRCLGDSGLIHRLE